MITLLVPTFDEFNKYSFIQYKEVKIKNRPDWKDINKITRFLPGIPQGGVGREPLKDLLTNREKPVREFYDSRQNTKMLRGYNVTVKPAATLTELQTELSRALMSQGQGPKFSKRLENKIQRLKDQISRIL